MDIRDWPFKGKRITNDYVQGLATFVGFLVWVVLFMLWFLPTVLITLGAGCYFLGREIWRDIRREWK